MLQFRLLVLFFLFMLGSVLRDMFLLGSVLLEFDIALVAST